MDEQYGENLPPTVNASADKVQDPHALRPTELSSAETQSRPQQGDAMNDDQLRLAQLRSKLLRIEGHKELSPKQKQAAERLVLEIADIETPNWREGLKDLFEELRTNGNDHLFR